MPTSTPFLGESVYFSGDRITLGFSNSNHGLNIEMFLVPKIIQITATPWALNFMNGLRDGSEMLI
jgi:hypothetical protein